jgi:DNA polymerase III epsilon subunit-like protein
VLKELLDSPLEYVTFIVFDTETSLMTYPGQPAFFDMVEIGGIVFNLKGEEIDLFHSLVKPYYPFNRVSCKAIHIAETALSTAPKFPEIVDSLAVLFTDKVIVGQNTQFDIRTVKQAIELYGNLGQIKSETCSQFNSILEEEFFDTKRLFSQLFPSEKEKSLDAIALKIGVNPDRTKHSGFEDACLTRDVFRKLVELTKSKNVITLGQLFNFQEGQHGKSGQISFF